MPELDSIVCGHGHLLTAPGHYGHTVAVSPITNLYSVNSLLSNQDFLLLVHGSMEKCFTFLMRRAVGL